MTDYDGAGLTPHAADLTTNYRVGTSCYALQQVSADGSRFVALNGGNPTCGQVITPARMDELLGPAVAS